MLYWQPLRAAWLSWVDRARRDLPWVGVFRCHNGRSSWKRCFFSPLLHAGFQQRYKGRVKLAALGALAAGEIM